MSFNLPFDEEPSLFAEMIRELASGIEEAEYDLATRYQMDPIGFMEDVLGEKNIWAKLVEIAESVRDNQYTAVQSANSVGKTWIGARLVLWWLKVYTPSKIITTAAPPERQIRELLWGELRSAYQKAQGRGAELFGVEPGIMTFEIDPNWWAKGFTIPQTGTREDRIARFQGHHSPHLLIIIDEAHGVPREVYEAVDRCMSGDHNHLLLLSNPLLASGPFYDAIRDRKFNIITVTAFDHPNVQTGKTVIPGCTTRDKVIERIKAWSRPLHKDEEYDAQCFYIPDYFPAPLGGQMRRVTFPSMDPVVLARFPTQASNALIALNWLQASNARWVPEQPVNDTDGIAGLDVAEMGADSNAWIVRQGGWCSEIERWNGVDVGKTGAQAIARAKEWKVRRVNVDAIGVGAGVPPHMRSADVEAVPVKVSEKPTIQAESGEFRSLRDQLYWSVREWLRTDPTAALPPDPLLMQELSVMTYDLDFRGNICVMNKKEMRDLISRSPDAAEALMLTFYTEKPWKKLKFIKV